MAAVSQTLVDFARRVRPVPTPGVTWDVTPERLLRFQPSFPIPGPNNCSEVRTAGARVGALIEDVRARFRDRGLPCMWLLDSDSEPADLGERLVGAGFVLDSIASCMVLPAGGPAISADPAITITDGLASLEAFHQGAEVAAAGFGGPTPLPTLERRYQETRARAGVHLLVAHIDGEPAGSGMADVMPEGTVLRAAAVHPGFRCRGVYRALVAARQRLAEAANSPGLVTQARNDTSAPILARMGFLVVGDRSFFRDAALTARDS